MKRHARVLVALVAVGTVGSACPVPPCGCPPTRQRARFYGTVADTAGPVAGATVAVGVRAPSQCAGSGGWDWGDLDTLTGPDGRYGLTSYEGWSADSNCVRVAAVRGAGAESVFVDLRARFTSEHEALRESVEVHLRFP